MMGEDSVPSTSDSTWKDDDFTVSLRSSNRVTRSVNSKKRKGSTEQQTLTDNVRRNEHSSKKLQDEKLLKSELRTKYSFVSKRRKAQTNEDAKDRKTVSSEFSEQCSSSTEKKLELPGRRNNSEVGFKPKSVFVINFTQPVTTDLIGDRVPKTSHSSHGDIQNVLHFINNISHGQHCSASVKQARKGPVLSHVASMKTFAYNSPFDRRVTALAYHPKYPSLLAAGSKGGELILWNTEEQFHHLNIPGVGAGGSVLALKFHHENPRIVYTASITGQILAQDFVGKDNMTFFETDCFDLWFSSLDTSLPHKLLLAGDTNGYLHLADLNGQKVWKKKNKVHKNKVTHIEFSVRDPYTFVTASLDHTVQIWDLRMFSDHEDRHYSINCLIHEKAVNSAYFNPSSGTSLLTTDQYNELRVYTAPLWHLETTIAHPHRQFQHLTPIKAQWHPLEDLIVVGRYPDDKLCSGDVRSIDIYDGYTGERMHYFNVAGITSLNAFSPTGDVLASASGSNITLWKAKEKCEGLSKISVSAVKKLLSNRVPRSRPSITKRSKSVTATKEKVKKTKNR